MNVRIVEDAKGFGIGFMVVLCYRVDQEFHRSTEANLPGIVNGLTVASEQLDH